jgi:hypothetical protein
LAAVEGAARASFCEELRVGDMLRAHLLGGLPFAACRLRWSFQTERLRVPHSVPDHLGQKPHARSSWDLEYNCRPSFSFRFLSFFLTPFAVAVTLPMCTAIN